MLLWEGRTRITGLGSQAQRVVNRGFNDFLHYFVLVFASIGGI